MFEPESNQKNVNPSTIESDTVSTPLLDQERCKPEGDSDAYCLLKSLYSCFCCLIGCGASPQDDENSLGACYKLLLIAAVLGTSIYVGVKYIPHTHNNNSSMTDNCPNGITYTNPIDSLVQYSIAPNGLAPTGVEMQGYNGILHPGDSWQVLFGNDNWQALSTDITNIADGEYVATPTTTCDWDDSACTANDARLSTVKNGTCIEYLNFNAQGSTLFAANKQNAASAIISNNLRRRA